MNNHNEFIPAVNISPILPPEDEFQLDFEILDCVVMSDKHAQVAIITDNEIDRDALEIGENSRVVFSTFSKYPYLCVHLKNVEKFMSITVACKCENDLIRELTFSNRRSNVHIHGNTLSAPLIISDGWQYVNIDLNKVLLNGFGVKFISCLEVVIDGSTRVSKMFLQEQEYADAELPPYLRMIQ